MHAPSIPTEHDPAQWFIQHFEDAAGQIIDFLESDGIKLEGATVADIGCGDGITDLGIALKAHPSKLIGYDLRPTDHDALRRAMLAAGIQDEYPDVERLNFVESQPDHIPAPNETFDIAFSWSVFEHVSRPIPMLQEVRRILKSEGVLFLQLWPFFTSRHGGHLWLSIDEAFAHLRHSPFDLDQQLSGRRGTDSSRTADDEFRSLNRITLDGLQRALLAARLRIAKVELMSETVHVPQDLAHLPLADLAISGIKLLANPF